MSWLTLIPILGSLALGLPILFLLARNRINATFLKEGTITAIVRGDSLKEFVPMIEGHTVEKQSFKVSPGVFEERWTIVERERKKTFLERHFGVYWYSLLWPFVSVFSTEIDARRLKESTGEGAPMEKLIEHETKVIHALRWKFPRPVLVRDVELADRFRISILAFMTFEVKHPYLPLFVFNGDFFELLDSAVESAVVDFCKEMTYEEFVTTDKGKGGSSGTSASSFTKRLLRINDEGEIPDAPDGILAAIGIKASDAFVYRFDLSEKDKKAQEAAQAEEIARLKAEALRRQAEGEGDADYLRRKGEARGTRKMLQALTAKYVTPEALNTYRRIQETRNIGSSDLSTWVEGGGNSGVLVGTDKKKPNKKEVDQNELD